MRQRTRRRWPKRKPPLPPHQTPPILLHQARIKLQPMRRLLRLAQSLLPSLRMSRRQFMSGSCGLASIAMAVTDVTVVIIMAATESSATAHALPPAVRATAEAATALTAVLLAVISGLAQDRAASQRTLHTLLARAMQALARHLLLHPLQRRLSTRLRCRHSWTHRQRA